MEKGKELDYFKDKVFDLLNRADSMDVKNIETDARNNTFRVSSWKFFISILKQRSTKYGRKYI